MSRMLCKCGSIMGTSVSPSPYLLYIFYDQEIRSAITENPKILLTDFLTDWDELNEVNKEYKKRSEPVEYWYCTKCHRVYETQTQMGGHWLRVYAPSEHQILNTSYEGWKQIHIFKDIETDAFLEDMPQLYLSDYLDLHKEKYYLISPDERTVIAFLKKESSIQIIYSLEESK